MLFLLAEISNFQGSTHQYGVGSFSKIKNILLAYKLFYVGCSRAKKELTVFVSARKVESYEQQFIDTFSKMGFEVCECKMGLPKN